MAENAEKQNKNSQPWLQPWQFKKGQSGNPNGRPKGKTLKEYCREFLASQTEEERSEFLNGLNKETIWKMAEGNPDTKSNVELEGELKINLINYGNTNTDQLSTEKLSTTTSTSD